MVQKLCARVCLRHRSRLAKAKEQVAKRRRRRQTRLLLRSVDRALSSRFVGPQHTLLGRHA